MNFEEFENNIVKWATEKGLITDDELIMSKQVVKLNEEVGELCEDFTKRDADEEHKKHLVDSIGDTLVVLINFAHQNGYTMQECYEKAWSHIKNRKGKMIDGTFVKDADIDK